MINDQAVANAISALDYVSDRLDHGIRGITGHQQILIEESRGRTGYFLLNFRWEDQYFKYQKRRRSREIEQFVEMTRKRMSKYEEHTFQLDRERCALRDVIKMVKEVIVSVQGLVLDGMAPEDPNAVVMIDRIDRMTKLIDIADTLHTRAQTFVVDEFANWFVDTDAMLKRLQARVISPDECASDMNTYFEVLEIALCAIDHLRFKCT